MKTLTIEIMTTEKCNLNCTYCYMDKVGGDLSAEHAKKFFDNLDRLLELYNCDKYNVSFFGGEPTLNWPIIELVKDIIKDDKRCLHFNIITNGTLLTPEKIKWWQDNGGFFSISFDGIWQKNNRPLKNGKDSFDYHMNRLAMFKSFGINYNKCMIKPENAATLLDNFKFAIEQDLYLDFSLVRDNIWKEEDIAVFDKALGETTDYLISIQQNDFIPNTFVGIYKLYVLDTIVNNLYNKRSYGCFAGTNGVALSPDGKVYPCARFANNRRFPLIDLVTDKWYLDNVAFLKEDKCTNNYKFESCQDCVLYQHCNAGCTYSQMEQFNFAKGEPVPVVCSLFKIAYREAYRLYNHLKQFPTFNEALKKQLTF